MGMFDNYRYDSGSMYNLTDCTKSIFKRTQLSPPNIVYDKAGNIRSASWNCTEMFSWTIPLKYYAFVEYDALIFDNADEQPTTNTKGNKCQKAYNTLTHQEWLCKGRHFDEYLWQEIPLETCSECGMRIAFNWEYTQKSVIVNIFNFRRELLKTTETNAADNLIFIVDKELSNLFVSGQYYLQIMLKDDIDNTELMFIPITIN